MTLDEAIKEFTDWAKGDRKEQNFWAAERDENDETNPLNGKARNPTGFRRWDEWRMR